MMEQQKEKFLIFESYAGLRPVFEAILAPQYELVFSDNPKEIMALLGRQIFRLLIWDLDRPTASLEMAMNAIRADGLRESTPDNVPINTLKAIRQRYPELAILLISGDFEYNFQLSVLRECGIVSFFTKPWTRTELLEKVAILLGEKGDASHHRVLKMPLDWQLGV